MEQNTSPMIAKKIWNLVRVAFYMLRKGICKRKILLDLNLVMKRSKIAGKALQNLMFHHYHHHHHHQHRHRRQKSNPSEAVVIEDTGRPSHHLHYFTSTPPGEYEFSCDTTPLYPHYFSNKKKQNPIYYTPYNSLEDMNNNNSNNDIISIEGVNNIFDLMDLSDNNKDVVVSPVGSGLNPRSTVRQLRITDSPFPEQNGEDGTYVDAAAEDFINKFYSQLKKQKYC